MSKIDLNPNQDYPDDPEFAKDTYQMLAFFATVGLIIVVLSLWACLALFDPK